MKQLDTGMTAPEACDEQRRFGGLQRLYGVAGAQSIRAAHVVVVGIGGVGSWAAEALARSGVGQITLIDMDHVAESNINRQVQALDATLGQAKVQAMRDRMTQIHPGAQVHCVEEFVTPENWLSLVPPGASAVIDACDQVRAKSAMAAWARAGHTPLVCVGAAGGKRHAHRVELGDLSLVTHDPLLAQLRYRLRKAHGAPRDAKPMGVACVFSREAVLAPQGACDARGDSSLNCHGYGSAVSVTACFGMVAAGWVLDQLTR